MIIQLFLHKLSWPPGKHLAKIVIVSCHGFVMIFRRRNFPALIINKKFEIAGLPSQQSKIFYGTPLLCLSSRAHEANVFQRNLFFSYVNIKRIPKQQTLDDGLVVGTVPNVQLQNPTKPYSCFHGNS